jgi:hypothetical protein
MRCTLDSEQLRARGQNVTKLLKPLIPTGQRLACRPRFLERQVVLSAYLGSEPPELDPDLWRFTTRVPKVRASYYERWIPTDFRQQTFALDRAYLHLYLRRDQHDETEILALHCDPNESQSERHYRYKVGPHIHMSTAEDPFPHVHVALNNHDLEPILTSVAKLTGALKSAIEMVDDQVLGLLKTS